LALPEFVFCAKALAAADFDAAEERPSLSTFEATEAAATEVVLPCALTCDRALPAAVLEFTPVDGEFSVLDALLAAFDPVFLLVAFAIIFSYRLKLTPKW
jgi:hypothetical protein